jgi:hypothetical protein
MEGFQSELYFKVWEYTVSHSSLLIRYSDSESNRVIDVAFGSVDYLQIPNGFRGLEIDEATEDEKERFSSFIQRSPSGLPYNKVYVLITENKRYFIIASFCNVYDHENGYDYNLASYFNSNVDGRLMYQNLNPSAADS